jgi:regulatory protein spx
MIKIYTISSCNSSKKAKKWLRLHGLEFEEIDLRASKMKRGEFNHLLSLTKLGTEELFSKRNVAYKKLIDEINIGSLSMKDFFIRIQQNQMILKRPIIVDENNLQIGYNEDDIRKFLPRIVREIEIKKHIEKIQEEYLTNNF